MIYLAAAVSLCLFTLGLRWSHAVETAGSAVLAAKSGIAMLLDANLPDEEKERIARTTSVRLLGHAVAIVLRFALATAAPVGFLGILIAAHLLSIDSLVEVVESWQFIAASMIVVSASLFWRR